ncbi:hypothetical protein BJS_00340 [Bradyrhizobium japonicum SEMIA 5079]|nr:hypothetical protein BJS_00340 [Bradyrhizobium japonicum SEMIA 5079]
MHSYRRLFAKRNSASDGLYHAPPPKIRGAISQCVDSALGRDVVDLATRQTDIHQLPVTQLLQGAPWALPPLLKRIPISPEQTQDDGEVEAKPHGIALNLG